MKAKTGRKREGGGGWRREVGKEGRRCNASARLSQVTPFKEKGSILYLILHMYKAVSSVSSTNMYLASDWLKETLPCM